MTWHTSLRLRLFRSGPTEEYSNSNVTFDTGAGTGPILNSISGGGNSCFINFTTGISPAGGSDVFTITYPLTGASSIVAISPLNAAAAAQMTNFYTTRFGNQLKLKVSAALPASTEFEVGFIIWLR
jgi:hypothetical protein